MLIEFRSAKPEEVEDLVKISKAAFDTDIEGGSTSAGGPPDYDNVKWHLDMQKTGNLCRENYFPMIVTFRYSRSRARSMVVPSAVMTTGRSGNSLRFLMTCAFVPVESVTVTPTG